MTNPKSELGCPMIEIDLNKFTLNVSPTGDGYLATLDDGIKAADATGETCYEAVSNVMIEWELVCNNPFLDKNILRIRNLPVHEQAGFAAYLEGKQCPYIEGETNQDGYYLVDYISWKN